MNTRKLFLRRMFFLLLLACPLDTPAQEQNKPIVGLQSIRQYIAPGWDNLTRSMTDCASVVDPKIKVHPVIYLPPRLPPPPPVHKLHPPRTIHIIPHLNL